MRRQSASSATAADDTQGTRRPVGLRPRALTALQESVFFAVVFALGVALQLAAVLLQASATG